MIDGLTNALYCVCQFLLVPDIVLLLILFIMTVLHLGGFVAEVFMRMRHGASFRAFVESLKRVPDSEIEIEAIPARFGLPLIAFHELREKSFDVDKTLDDLQLHSEKLLGRINLGVRLGPVLGLAGTLIPLGPALVALSSGDVATLSSKLVVAFSTTVVGLFIGGVSFAIYSIRRSWYMKELSDIEFIARKL